jgi:hypothetical protein
VIRLREVVVGFAALQESAYTQTGRLGEESDEETHQGRRAEEIAHRRFHLSFPLELVRLADRRHRVAGAPSACRVAAGHAGINAGEGCGTGVGLKRCQRGKLKLKRNVPL